MNSTIGVDKCLSFINAELHPGLAPHDLGRRFTAVTISRQAGSGGHDLAARLSELLQTQEPQPSWPWTVFDRDLVEKALEDHNLPKRLARFLPEDHVSEITDTMDELFGLHPPSWVLIRQTSETILRLAKVGHVILIGRGANVVTSRFPEVFHVRLVGSLAQRVKRLQIRNHLSRDAALKLAEREDLARQRYLKQFFSKSIDDPLLYHLVINTDVLSIEDAAKLIALEMSPKAAVT